MEKGMSDKTRYALNYIGKEKLEEIEDYIIKVLSEECKIFTNPEEIDATFNLFLNEFYDKTNYVEREEIKNYTGLNFRKINSILRGIWDYDNNFTI